MKYYETELNDYILNELIILSKEWEEENSTRGYFSNKESDIKGNRIFIAEDNKKIIGYLFGKIEVQERDTTVYKNGVNSVTVPSTNISLTKNYVAGQLYSVTVTARASNGNSGQRTITL